MDGSKLSPLLVVCCLAFLAASGCGSPVQSEKALAPGYTIPTGHWVDPNNPDPTEDPNDQAGFFLKVTSDSATVTLHRSDTAYGGDPGTGNFSTECRIEEGTSLAADKDILCIAEVEELDLFFSELKIQYHFPPSMCSYAKFLPYHFYAYEPGNGETNLTVTFDVDGSVIANSAGVDPATGEPTCAYDYSADGGTGPNCCVGSYTLTTTQKNTPDPDTISISSGDWGGKASSCLTGPALSESYSDHISVDGYPLTSVTYVEGKGLNDTFTIPATIKATFGGYLMDNNFYAANFYKVSDHSAQSPGVLPADRPLAMRNPANLTISYLPSDTYKFECHNRAEEIQYRIRLMIREWNTHPIAQGGDPDVTVGNDPDFPDGPINDRGDWFDLGNAYPGASL
jgi:hypothetical protein